MLKSIDQCPVTTSINVGSSENHYLIHTTGQADENKCSITINGIPYLIRSNLMFNTIPPSASHPRSKASN